MPKIENVTFLESQLLYSHLSPTIIGFQNTERQDRRTDAVHYPRALGIRKVASNYKISTTARNLVPFHKTFHYIKIGWTAPEMAVHEQETHHVGLFLSLVTQIF